MAENFATKPLDFDDPVAALDSTLSEIQEATAQLERAFDNPSDRDGTSDQSLTHVTDAEEKTVTSATPDSPAENSRPGPAVQKGFFNKRPGGDRREVPSVAEACGHVSTSGSEDVPSASTVAALHVSDDVKKEVSRHSDSATAQGGFTYEKWDKFDVDAALREMDELATAEVERKGETCQAGSGDPKPKPKPAVKRGFLNKVPKKVSRPLAALKEEVFVIQGLESRLETQSDRVESTAAALKKEYDKWERYDENEEVNELDDDDEFTAMARDLDALSGPQDEVARIHAHWKKELQVRQKSARAAVVAEATKKEQRKYDNLKQGPVTHRPCEYRTPNHPEAAAAKAVARDYSKWKQFDVDGALLELDNEGKTEEGNMMRVGSTAASATLSAEGYKKDREEFELDEEIEEKMGGLKKIFGQRLKDAAGCKAEGNRLLREGRSKEACKVYSQGLGYMELCEQATVIMSESMALKNTTLVADLHRNLAAAQLAAGDFEGARNSCDVLLLRPEDNKNTDPVDTKALFRRATALLRLGNVTEARRDIERLTAMGGAEDAALKRLREELRIAVQPHEPGCVR